MLHKWNFKCENNAYSWEGIVCGWSVSKIDEKWVRRIISLTSELRLCSAPSFWPEVRWEQTKHIRDWNKDMLTETDPYISNHNLVKTSSQIETSNHHTHIVKCHLPPTIDAISSLPPITLQCIIIWRALFSCHRSKKNSSELTKYCLLFSGMEAATLHSMMQCDVILSRL